MHPVVCKVASVGAFRLCNLVFVVGEDQILTAAVNINGLAEIFPCHCGTFNVPPGSAVAPRGRPERLARFCAFPKAEIHRVFLNRRNVNTRARLKILKRLVGQFAVILKSFCAEINVAAAFISIALFDKSGNQRLNSVNIFGCARVNGRFAHIQPLGVGSEFFNIPLGNLRHCYAFLVCLFYEFIVNIREILYKSDLISAPFKVPAKHVKHADRACIAYMNKVINCGAAGVNFYLALGYRGEFVFISCKGIVNFHFPSPLNSSICFSSR